MSTIAPADAKNNPDANEIIQAFVPDISNEKYMELVDQLEYAITLVGDEKDTFPLSHGFCPGIYSRKLTAPAGALITSQIHNTEHPFVMTKGRVLVFSVGTGWTELQAPYYGVTKPGTRRIAIVLEEMEWTTFHATQLTDPDKIIEEICTKRDEHIKAALVQKALLQQQIETVQVKEGAES